jgi:predicted N-acetyltransferase YhbS
MSYSTVQKTPDDDPAIEKLLDDVFGLARRTKTSYRLREGSVPVPGLSLVVRDPELVIAGSISFWPLKIGAAGTDAILLGPLAVHSSRQNLGIGKCLMLDGINIATQMGIGLMLLVGDEPYYSRVGFKPLPDAQILMPGPIDRKRLLYLELIPGTLSKTSGMVLPPHRFATRSTAFTEPHR